MWFDPYLMQSPVRRLCQAKDYCGHVRRRDSLHTDIFETAAAQQLADVLLDDASVITRARVCG